MEGIWCLDEFEVAVEKSQMAAQSKRPRTHPKQPRQSRNTTLLIVLIVLAVLCVPLLIPVVIVLVKYAWPSVRSYFDGGLESLEDSTDEAAN